MFARLRGVIDDIQSNVVTIDVAGVGYEVYCTNSCVAQLLLGAESKLLVYTEVKAESIRIFGFSDALEKQLFLLLIEVQGIGPRTAMEVISAVEPRQLLRAIGQGDVEQLRAVKGVGKKTAERIVVELKDKVAARIGTVESGSSSRLVIERERMQPIAEACLALESLGFSRKDAEAALGKVNGAHTDAAMLIKEALRFV